jgi:hypothetical protein
MLARVPWLEDTRGGRPFAPASVAVTGRLAALLGIDASTHSELLLAHFAEVVASQPDAARLGAAEVFWPRVVLSFRRLSLWFAGINTNEI